MTKVPNQEWTQLAGAALGARNELRALAADLSAAMNRGTIPRSLIIRSRDVAVRNADALRIALKHPEAEPPRRKLNRDMPVWMTIEGER
ncbi:MAG TPA: hypothetical protein VHZ74_13930 [Bryobacteraceae bacterium]|jgi:hypothetical protein|nr:hypothetical protein [Bryobacteraceae bacterium]